MLFKCFILFYFKTCLKPIVKGEDGRIEWKLFKCIFSIVIVLVLSSSCIEFFSIFFVPIFFNFLFFEEFEGYVIFEKLFENSESNWKLHFLRVCVSLMNYFFYRICSLNTLELFGGKRDTGEVLHTSILFVHLNAWSAD